MLISPINWRVTAQVSPGRWTKHPLSFTNGILPGGEDSARVVPRFLKLFYGWYGTFLRTISGVYIYISTYSKGKEILVCDNHPGTSLLSVAGKILARVLLNRLNEHHEQSGLLPESQCGFKKDRGTIDMIFTARQLQEKCQEQNVDLYMTFDTAFDTVSLEGLWKINAKFGCPAKFIAMVRQFHDGMLARVQNDGEFSDPFPVTNGVKQGCVLSSTLFSMMFSAMLRDAFQDGDNGIPIRYRFDGKLFNLWRFQAKSKV